MADSAPNRDRVAACEVGVELAPLPLAGVEEAGRVMVDDSRSAMGSDTEADAMVIAARV